MANSLLNVAFKNIVGIPLLGAQSAIASTLTDPTVRSVVDVGISAQAIGLAGENIAFAKKKVKFF